MNILLICWKSWFISLLKKASDVFRDSLGSVSWKQEGDLFLQGKMRPAEQRWSLSAAVCHIFLFLCSLFYLTFSDHCVVKLCGASV